MIYLLPHIIAETAARFPEKNAFRCRGDCIDYGTMAARVEALAHTLIDQGVRRGDRVGIYMHKSVECAVAIYGIMRAGAAYVPLDPMAPLPRIRFILQNCAIRHLVAGNAQRNACAALAEDSPLECVIGPSGVEIPSVRTLSWDDVASAPHVPPAVRLVEDDLAYIMYTSGSTGDPKGMMHTHKSGLSYARMSAHLYDLTPADRLSNHSPLHFDMSTFDYFSGPLAAATTTIIPEEYTKLPASLSQLIENERLTVWYSVPYALIQLLLRGVLEERDLSSLRWILYGGEPFPPKHLRRLMQALPGARFGNVYGPAEVNQCTYYHVPPIYAEEDTDETTPIGVECPNVESLVVGADDRPVAVGCVGELLIRTPTMMAGYWERPDLNARAFYQRRSVASRDETFYRTGDLVEQMPDGNFKFLGRKDRQVKVRGYRVELDEVEVALLAHAEVEEAAVFAVPDAEHGLRIEAAVIAKAGSQTDAPQLMQHAAELLPAYALPAQIVLMANFPRTSSGKIDRRSLQMKAADVSHT